jgi:hypothetical protein
VTENSCDCLRYETLKFLHVTYGSESHFFLMSQQITLRIFIEIYTGTTNLPGQIYASVGELILFMDPQYLQSAATKQFFSRYIEGRFNGLTTIRGGPYNGIDSITLVDGFYHVFCH